MERKEKELISLEETWRKDLISAADLAERQNDLFSAFENKISYLQRDIQLKDAQLTSLQQRENSMKTLLQGALSQRQQNNEKFGNSGGGSSGTFEKPFNTKNVELIDLLRHIVANFIYRDEFQAATFTNSNKLIQQSPAQLFHENILSNNDNDIYNGNNALERSRFAFSPSSTVASPLALHHMREDDSNKKYNKNLNRSSNISPSSSPPHHYYPSLNLSLESPLPSTRSPARLNDVMDFSSAIRLQEKLRLVRENLNSMKEY